MSRVGLPARSIERGGARVEVARIESNCVEIVGTMREADSAVWLRPLIDELHRQAVESSLREVILDIRRLEYANAAVWKCFVLWLRAMRDDPEAGYRLRVLSEPSHKWQKVGMSALSVFGGERLIIE